MQIEPAAPRAAPASLRRRRRATAVAALGSLLAVGVLGVAGAAGTAAAKGQPGDDDQVCRDLGSRKIDTHNDPQSVTLSARPGMLISAYCVKAGSSNQGDGPQYVTLDTPLPSIAITYWSKESEKYRAISHYSYAEVPGIATSTPTPTPTPTPEPTPPPMFPPNPPSTPDGPFDWNWEYADPTCAGLVVAYPGDLPEGQANDVNIRLLTDQGQVTLNYHHNEGTWSGTRAFPYSQHRSWPVGVTSYEVQWIQVAGTNYHWQGSLRCLLEEDGDVTTLDVPRAVTAIEDFDDAEVTLRRGESVAPAMVAVDQPGLSSVELQRLARGDWTTRTTLPADSGRVLVSFPQERRKGTYRYRLVVPGSESVTGAVSGVLKVTVRR